MTVFWPFLGILGIFPSKEKESYTFYCIVTNFMYMCLRINNINLGTRPFKRCYWFTKFHEERVFGPFWHFCAHCHSKTKNLSFYCIATNFMCMCLKINCKNLGTRPLIKCYWFLVSSRAVFYCFWSFFGICFGNNSTLKVQSQDFFVDSEAYACKNIC